MRVLSSLHFSIKFSGICDHLAYFTSCLMALPEAKPSSVSTIKEEALCLWDGRIILGFTLVNDGTKTEGGKRKN